MWRKNLKLREDLRKKKKRQWKIMNMSQQKWGWTTNKQSLNSTTCAALMDGEDSGAAVTLNPLRGKNGRRAGETVRAEMQIWWLLTAERNRWAATNHACIFVFMWKFCLLSESSNSKTNLFVINVQVESLAEICAWTDCFVLVSAQLHLIFAKIKIKCQVQFFSSLHERMKVIGASLCLVKPSGVCQRAEWSCSLVDRTEGRVQTPVDRMGTEMGMGGWITTDGHVRHVKSFSFPSWCIKSGRLQWKYQTNEGSTENWYGIKQDNQKIMIHRLKGWTLHN